MGKTASTPSASSDNKSVARVRCHGCDAELVVPATPVLEPGDPTAQPIYPRLHAPFICPACRPDPARFAAARKEMERYL